MIKEYMEQDRRILEFKIGYAVWQKDALYIPAISGNMSEILKELYAHTKQKRMIFTAVLNPDSFRKHLHNIKREWNEWVKEMKDYSYCIEIEYKGEDK